MEFLKEILGEELFSQVQEKINAHNGADENKDKQIKLANLSSGEYVSKGKFSDKETELASKIQELTKANSLIEEMKKTAKGNDALQGKITDYESQVAQLQQELTETKLKAAVKVGLIGEKALDIDYLSYKLNEKLTKAGEKLELDESGNIKGWKDKIDSLKNQFPTQFESSSQKKIDENKLPDNNQGSGAQPESLAGALKEHYEMKG